MVFEEGQKIVPSHVFFLVFHPLTTNLPNILFQIHQIVKSSKVTESCVSQQNKNSFGAHEMQQAFHTNVKIIMHEGIKSFSATEFLV